MRVIQVHEHQQISIGEILGDVRFSESDHDSLAIFAQKHKHNYYQLQYRSIKFSHYVGAMQIGDLTIEILPKADRNSSFPVWRNALLDMLRYCKILNIETLGSASLLTKSNSILELYYAYFLEEIDKLLKIGLQKGYQNTERNSTNAKGQIQFAQQIQKNYLHKERFYTRFQDYNYNNLLNQILWKTLNILEQMPLSIQLHSKLRIVKANFPSVESIKISAEHFKRLRLHRTAAHYKPALDIAELLISRFRPDIRAGNRNLIAVLFDMNLLFEEYIFRQLQQLQHANLKVLRQQSKPFWNRRFIRPDIILELDQERMVLDTKWKILERVNPNMQDLQQAFTYAQYFDARKVALIYPRVNILNDLSPTPFQASSNEKDYFCQVHFAEVIRDGRLNLHINESILKALT